MARTRGQTAVLDELGAERGRAAVLPDDGPVQRPARRTVEGDERLALVGDADGRHGVARRSQACADLGQRGPHGIPDLGRVVLDPPGTGEVLGQLPVGDVGHPVPPVDGQGAHARRARIDGDDDPGHGPPTLTVRGYSSSGEPRPGGSRAQTIANGP